MTATARGCAAEHCSRPYVAKGLCRHHYHARYTKGSAEARSAHDQWWVQHKPAWDRKKPPKRGRIAYDFAGRVLVRVPYLKDDICAYCGGPGGSIDHIEPPPLPVPRNTIDDLDRPENHWTNLTAACLACNSRKRRKSLLGFLYSLRADDDIEQICRGVSIGMPKTAPGIRRRRFASDDSRPFAQAA